MLEVLQDDESEHRCSFCSQTCSEMGFLLVGDSAAICSSCVQRARWAIAERSRLGPLLRGMQQWASLDNREAIFAQALGPSLVCAWTVVALVNQSPAAGGGWVSLAAAMVVGVLSVVLLCAWHARALERYPRLAEAVSCALWLGSGAGLGFQSGLTGAVIGAGVALALWGAIYLAGKQRGRASRKPAS